MWHTSEQHRRRRQAFRDHGTRKARNKSFQVLVEEKVETGRDIDEFQNLEDMTNYLGRLTTALTKGSAWRSPWK